VRAEDVEVADCDCLQPIDAGETAHVVLAGEFAYGIWRNRIGDHVFALGKRGLVSVG
jgi:hypothetical protein